MMQLLPCPFCGCEAKGSWSFGAYYVECTNSVCCAHQAWSKDDPEIVAANMWNTRSQHSDKVITIPVEEYLALKSKSTQAPKDES